uniref:GK21316 n=1 Tax=Drosophila willistoni TaxID=7260 RepID=B4MR82_DROWI
MDDDDDDDDYDDDDDDARSKHLSLISSAGVSLSLSGLPPISDLFSKKGEE